MGIFLELKNVPEDIPELFHFLTSKLVGLIVIQECPCVGNGACVDLQRNMSEAVAKTLEPWLNNTGASWLQALCCYSLQPRCNV